jgi:hypothetical protein
MSRVGIEPTTRSDLPKNPDQDVGDSIREQVTGDLFARMG